MAVIYEDVHPTLIANTTMKKKIFDGVFKVYAINANEGYVLHDKNYDSPVLDENYNETGEVILGFRPPASTATVAANYDFEINPRELYTVSENEIPTEPVDNTTIEASTSDLYNALAELGVE